MPPDIPTSVHKGLRGYDPLTLAAESMLGSRKDRRESLAPQLENIPSELTLLPRWLPWRYSQRPNAFGRFGKVPYNIADKKADYTNPSEWLPFATVVRQYSRGNYDGIGLVLGLGLCGLDEDHCVNEDGFLDADAARHLGLLNSYSEFSVSGDGMHCLAFGKLPDGPRKRGNHELYADNRFFVVTGHKLPDALGSVAHREQELLQLHSMLFGETASRSETPDASCPKTPEDSEFPASLRDRGH
jgi:putative DNA primase/helicase